MEREIEIQKSESESCSVVSDSLWPHGLAHGILQARKLEWAAFPLSRGASQPRDQTQVFHSAGGFFISSASREAHKTDVIHKVKPVKEGEVWLVHVLKQLSLFLT